MTSPGWPAMYVRSVLQRIVNGAMDRSRVCKQVTAFATPDRDVRRGGFTIFPRPRVNVLEEDSMGFQHLLIGERVDLLQIVDCFLKAIEKRAVLILLDRGEVAKASLVAQIAALLKVTKRIE